MNKILTVIALFIITNSVNADWLTSEGELRIKGNKKGATIFIDGKKKGVVGDGLTIIKVSEGDHKIRVFKHTQEWDYEGIEYTFVADRSSIEIHIDINQSPTQYRINRLKKERIDRENRLAQAEIDRERKLIAKKIRLAQEKQVIFGQHAKRYIDNNNGTITDKITGLMWKQCVEGLSGKECQNGTINMYTVKKEEAQKHAKNIDFAGFSDWRVPTIKELITLVYCSNGKKTRLKQGRAYNSFTSDGCHALDNYRSPTINQLTFPRTPSVLLSVNRAAWGASYLINFRNGKVKTKYFHFDYEVRLVRSNN